MIRAFCGSFGRLSEVSAGWEFHQSTVEACVAWGGRENIILFEKGRGQLRKMNSEQERDRRRDLQGANAWGKKGVAVSLMTGLAPTLYSGEKFDTNVSAIIPENADVIPAIWAYCSSSDFAMQVRRIDQKLNVTNATLVKIPFDLAHWQKVAAEKYPHGLPKPFSDDPTQWLFNGHPRRAQTSRCTSPWRGCSATGGRARPARVFPIARRSARTGWKPSPMRTASSASPPREANARRRTPARTPRRRLRQGLVARRAGSVAGRGRLRRHDARGLAARRVLRAALRALPSSPLHLAHLGRPEERLLARW